MKSRFAKFFVSMSLTVFLIVSCASPATSPEAATDIPTSTSPPQEIPTNAMPPTASPPASEGFTPSADDIAIEPDKNTLIITTGYGRILKNGVKDWTAVVSGEWLENGDQIQLTEDSNAMIWLRDGSLIAFSGPTDFRLINADKDSASGRIKVTGQLFTGMVLAQVVPLPTADSIFQIHFATNLISVDYSESAAVEYKKGTVEAEDVSAYFGGELGEDEDTFIQIQGPLKMYDVQKVGENYYAVEYPSPADSSAEINIPVLDDETIEGEIQSLLPEIGVAMRLLTSSQPASMGAESVLKVIANGILPSGGKQRVIGFSTTDGSAMEIPFSKIKTVKPDLYQMSLPQLTLIPSESTSGQSATHGMSRKILMNASLFLPAHELGSRYSQKICRPEYGYGCKYPAGCDKKTGQGCELATGCNLVTRKGCQKARKHCLTGGTMLTICYRTYPKYALKCKANVKGDCDKFYDPAKFTLLEAENCCVCNPPNTKNLPGWKYFHMDDCSEPGARPAGTCGPSTCK